MKRPVSVVLVLIVVTTAAAAETFAQRTRRTPEEVIRAADQQWMKVFAAKDMEKSVAFCADDGSIMAPNSPIATGREAIKNMFSGFFSLPGLKISWQPLRTEVAKSGELGFTSGAYQMTVTDAAGKPIEDKGKYVTVWKKQRDGSWKVLLDIFNSDLATPPA